MPTRHILRWQPSLYAIVEVRYPRLVGAVLGLELAVDQHQRPGQRCHYQGQDQIGSCGGFHVMNEMVEIGT